MKTDITLDEEAQKIFKELDAAIDELLRNFEIYREETAFKMGMEAATNGREAELCIAMISIYKACLAQSINPAEFMKVFHRQRYQLLSDMSKIDM